MKVLKLYSLIKTDFPTLFFDRYVFCNNVGLKPVSAVGDGEVYLHTVLRAFRDPAQR